jgi:hypothetical protein
MLDEWNRSNFARVPGRFRVRQCELKMRQRDGEVVGERGLYACRGSGDEAESTACGAAAVAAAEVEIKLPPCEGDGWHGRAIGQPSTARAAGLEFPHRFTYHVRLHVCSQRTPHVNKSICLVSYLSLIRCGKTQSLVHREEFIQYP